MAAPIAAAAGAAAAPSPAAAALPKDGVTLAFLERFVTEHCGGRAALAGLTTSDVCRLFVQPATAAAATSWAAAGPPAVVPGEVGPASHFVTHAWGMPFLDLLECLHTFSAGEAAKAAAAAAAAAVEAAGAGGAGGAAAPAYFLLDIFTNNQHETADHTFEWWTRVVRDRIGSIGHTVVPLEYADPKPLSRAWPIWELLCAFEACATVDFVLSPASAAAFEQELLEDAARVQQRFSTVDVSQARCYNREDEDAIQAAIAAGPGTAGLNARVAALQQSWAMRHVLACAENALAAAGPAADAAQRERSLALLAALSQTSPEQDRLVLAEMIQRLQ